MGVVCVLGILVFLVLVPCERRGVVESLVCGLWWRVVGLVKKRWLGGGWYEEGWFGRAGVIWTGRVGG